MSVSGFDSLWSWSIPSWLRFKILRRPSRCFCSFTRDIFTHRVGLQAMVSSCLRAFSKPGIQDRVVLSDFGRCSTPESGGYDYISIICLSKAHNFLCKYAQAMTVMMPAQYAPTLSSPEEYAVPLITLRQLPMEQTGKFHDVHRASPCEAEVSLNLSFKSSIGEGSCTISVKLTFMAPHFS